MARVMASSIVIRFSCSLHHGTSVTHRGVDLPMQGGARGRSFLRVLRAIPSALPPSPGTLLQLFQNLVQWGGLASRGVRFSRGALTSPFVIASSVIGVPGAIPMGRLPHIPHGDIPRAVLELADLCNIHPAPVFADFDLIVRA